MKTAYRAENCKMKLRTQKNFFYSRFDYTFNHILEDMSSTFWKFFMVFYEKMMREVNRVLSYDGIAIVIEPTLTHRTSSQAINSPSHYYQKNHAYIRAFIGRAINQYIIKGQIRPFIGYPEEQCIVILPN